MGGRVVRLEHVANSSKGTRISHLTRNLLPQILEQRNLDLIHIVTFGSVERSCIGGDADKAGPPVLRVSRCLHDNLKCVTRCRRCTTHRWPGGASNLSHTSSSIVHHDSPAADPAASELSLSPPPASSMTNDVQFRGTMGLLQLRGGGGGPRDEGKGVADWLDDWGPQEVDAAAPRQNALPVPAVSSDIVIDSRLPSAVGPAEATRGGPGGHDHPSLSPPPLQHQSGGRDQPRSSRSLGQRGEGSLEVSLISPERPQPPVAPTIFGVSSGTKIIVCGACCRDIPIVGITWRQCGCGSFRCETCARVACRQCGTTAVEGLHDFGAVLEGSPISVDPRTGSDMAYSFDEVAAFAWDRAFGGAQADVRSHASALTCSSCTVESRGITRSWCICRCGLTFCQCCYARGCDTCGARIPVRRVATQEDDFGTEERGLDSDCQDTTSEDGSGVDGRLHMPIILTPEAAFNRRARLLAEHAQTRMARRVHQRLLARAQCKSGMRPRRQRMSHVTVSFASANVTAAERLHEELKRGGELAQCDFIGVQELGLYGETLAHAEALIKRIQWSGFIDPAYRKHGGYGGGTGVLSRHLAGVRRIGGQSDLLKGRLSLACSYFGHSVITASFYGLSGGGPWLPSCPIGGSWRIA